MLRRTISSRLLATNKSSSLERFAVQKECPQLLQITKGPHHSLWRCKSTSTTNATFQQHHRQQLQQQQQARILHETLQRVTLRDRLRSFLLKPRTLPIPRWISPRHFTITLSEVCGHASFILVAISYAVDDFLHLRLIAVAGSSVMLCFTYFHPHGRVLWLPFQWNALFIVINSFRIGKTYADRYFAEILSPEMKRVRDRHLYILDPPDFKRMYQLAKVEEYKAGDLITPQGQMNPFVRFVVDGQLDVLRDGLSNYILQEGNFVAECGLHVGLLLPGKVESCCSIVAKTDCRVLCWERDSLMDLLFREKALRRALKAALSWDIVSKLKAQRLLLQAGAIDNPEAWTKRRTDQSQHRYAAILQNCLSHPGYMNTRKQELMKMRMMHHIDDKFHEEALKRCGWTVEEFERGYKEGQDVPDCDDELHHDWKWHVTNLILRIFW